MVSHFDVTMYLVAVKSLYWQLGQGEIVIMNDGTLTSADRETLSYHLNSPKFVDMSSVATGAFPRGGCWERLLTILDLSKDFYVIQLDSDTLTFSAVPEITDCILQNKCFTLGTADGNRFVTLAEASAAARVDRNHVQDVAERNLICLPQAVERRYVRGSAGFAGFAKGLRLKSLAEEFSQKMREVMGDKWSEWGSEQVMSNYLVANAPSATVLPHPKYTCFYRQEGIEEPSFIHFIGMHRYADGVYGRESQTLIRNWKY